MIFRTGRGNHACDGQLRNGVKSGLGTNAWESIDDAVAKLTNRTHFGYFLNNSSPASHHLLRLCFFQVSPNEQNTTPNITMASNPPSKCCVVGFRHE